MNNLKLAVCNYIEKNKSYLFQEIPYVYICRDLKLNISYSTNSIITVGIIYKGISFRETLKFSYDQISLWKNYIKENEEILEEQFILENCGEIQ